MGELTIMVDVCIELTLGLYHKPNTHPNTQPNAQINSVGHLISLY